MRYQNIVILTGAGVSAESGIPVFRSEDGLWEKHKVEDVATYEGFLRNKTLVHNFYNAMRRSLPSKLPNKAHFAIAHLQKEWQEYGGEAFLVTQNIDDLHERAGSSQVVHMHGELNRLLCENCHTSFPFTKDSSINTKCPYCGHKSVRPDIVWFGEVPYDMDEIYDKLLKCDLFLAIGTSGVVYPAAGFCQMAAGAGATCVEFNLEKSLVASNFNYGIYGKASVTLSAFIDKLIAHKDSDISLFEK